MNGRGALVSLLLLSLVGGHTLPSMRSGASRAGDPNAEGCGPLQGMIPLGVYPGER